MKSLTEYVTESRISPFELKKYVKSSITNSSNYNDYIQYLKTVIEGLNEGIVENIRYYKGKEAVDAEKFSMIIDDLMEFVKKSIK